MQWCMCRVEIPSHLTQQLITHFINQPDELQARWVLFTHGSFHFELWMRRWLCVLCASLPQQAFILKHCPEEISQTLSLCYLGMLPPFTQDFSWSFTVKLVHRKTFSNKGTGDQRGNNVFRAVKRQEMAGSHDWLIVSLLLSFIHFLLDSSLDQHSLHHLSALVFNLQQSKGLFPQNRSLSLVWFML